MDDKVLQIEGLQATTFFNEFDKLRDQIKELNERVKNTTKQQENKIFYTRAEVKKMFNTSYPTLNNWKKKGVLVPSRLGSRIVYKLEDINNALIKIDK